MGLPFHIGYGSPICYKRLQSDRLCCKVLEMGINRGASAFQPTNFRVLRAIIADMKEENQDYLLIVQLGSTDILLHFGLSLFNPLEDNKLPYA